MIIAIDDHSYCYIPCTNATSIESEQVPEGLTIRLVKDIPDELEWSVVNTVLISSSVTVSYRDTRIKFLLPGGKYRVCMFRAGDDIHTFSILR